MVLPRMHFPHRQLPHLLVPQVIRSRKKVLTMKQPKYNCKSCGAPRKRNKTGLCHSCSAKNNGQHNNKFTPIETLFIKSCYGLMPTKHIQRHMPRFSVKQIKSKAFRLGFAKQTGLLTVQVKEKSRRGVENSGKLGY